MYYSRNRTITCRLFLWALLFAIFFFVPDLQAQESAKEKLIAPSMDSWINSIATFAVSLGVLFLLLVFSVLVIMFWGVVSSIKSIINVFTEKEREDISISQEQLRCRLATKKTKAATITYIRDKLNDIRKDLDTIRTQASDIAFIRQKLEEIKNAASTLGADNVNQKTRDIQNSTSQIENRLSTMSAQTSELNTIKDRITTRVESTLEYIRSEIRRLRGQGCPPTEL